MENKLNKIKFVLNILNIFMILLLIGSTFNFFNSSAVENRINKINRATLYINGIGKNITFPYISKNLKKDSEIFLMKSLKLKKDEALYLKAVYTPAKIYINNTLVGELGKLDDYPIFMNDIATEAKIIQPKIFNKNVLLKIEYKVPKHTKNMIIHSPLIGTTRDILYYLIFSKGVFFILSIILLVIGIILALMSSLAMIFEKRYVIFFHLGMFSFFCGLWGFGESNLSLILIKNYSLLYMLSFVSLFTLIIPLINFLNSAVTFKYRAYLSALSLSFSILLIAILLLQFLGIVPLSKSLFLFHILNPSTLVILNLLLIYEWIWNKNITAERFIIPISCITIGAILEVFNYAFKFTFSYVTIFQISIFLFIITACVVGSLYISDMKKIQEKEKALLFEIGLIKTQVSEQKKQHKLMLEYEDNLKKQQHDLKHHLAVIKKLSYENIDKLHEYLEELTQKLPNSNKKFCENIAVNSVVSYYESICKRKNIITKIELIIPEFNKQISDSDLAIILGNLLENAIEACEKVKNNRFIHLKSILQYNMLIITMDNSFDGELIIKDEKFYSTKRDDFGIGLSSIIDIAQKHNGNATFEKNGYVFMSNVYFQIN